MLNCFRKMSWTMLIVVACCFMQPQTASAQLEFLKGLLGGKAAPAPAKTFQPFRGYQALSQAVAEAENGDLAKSLTLVSEAFKEGGVSEPLEHPEAQAIATNLMRLSKAWESKGAKPADVVAVLMDVVLPSKTPGVVRPYVGQWQLSFDAIYLSRSNGRFPPPESVGAELVRWAVLAKQTDEVKKRLEAAKPDTPQEKSDKPTGADSKTADKAKADAETAAKIEAAVARVFSVQLAVAEHDAELANKSLKQLLEEAKSANGPMLEYLCQAVMASMREPKSEAAGLSLLEAVLDRAEESLPAESGFRGNAPWLRVRAAEVHARAGRAADTKRLAMAVVAKPFSNRQYGAEYSAYLEHSLKQQAAAALIDAGLIADGLELAGQAPDPQAVRYFRANGAVDIAAKVGHQLRQLAPAERFELLRKWALPSDDRDSVRSLIDFVPNVAFRSAKGEAFAERKPTIGVLSDVYSTDWELVSTARELGKLDEFVRELISITPQTPSVQSLRTLAMVVRDGSANASKGADQAAGKSTAALGANTTTARLKGLLEATTAAVPAWNVQEKPQPPMDTYVIAVEAAVHPEWRATAEAILFRLIEHGQRTQSQRLRDHFRVAWLETLRLRSFDVLPTVKTEGKAAGPGEVAAHWLKMRPKMWDVIGFESATERATGALPPTWFAHEGYLSHVSNGRESDLVFGMPLSGTFELTLECREGGWSEGRIGYGGAGFQIYAYQDAAHLTGKGNSGYEGSPKLTNLLNKEPWNRYTIRVDGNSVKYFANGQPVFEDQPGTAAPWLTFGSMSGFTPSYRNLRISGSPTIPREVALLGDERLRGWLATYFDESKPDALRTRKYLSVKVTQNGQQYNQIVEDDGTMEGEPVQIGQGATDWMFADGELRSARRSDFFGGESPSWLTYQRPLRDRETVRFEFWHQPGATTACPTFGETVFALGSHASPERGRATKKDDRATNPPTLWRGVATTAVANAELRTGWNSVAMSLNGGLFAIELNGNEIVSEKIEPTNSRRIGFFHDAATTDLRVRNVVLSGDWPQEFDAATRAAIESPEPNDKLANSRFLTLALSEERISDNAFEVARQAVKLDTAERYKFLHRWVMPNESHDLLRTTGAFTPTHPAPPLLNENPIDVAMAEARQAVDQRLVQTGGNFVCPAILLVLAAAELDRLDELKQEVLKHSPTSSPEMARGRAALLGIIALLQDRPDEALANVWECHNLVTEQEGPQYARWGDVALASLAIQHPTTREAAYQLLDRIKSKQLQASKPGKPEFARFVRQLHGQVHYLMHGGASEEFGTQPKTKQWRTVSQTSAQTRGSGYPIASFDVIAGEMAERGGHDFDGAYFQSPLRGNYEVRCRLSDLDYRESMLMAAGVANTLVYSHTQTSVVHARTPIAFVPTPAPIAPRVLSWHDYKIVVKDGRYTSFVNGQKLYETDLPEQPDPWLAVVGLAGHSSRSVRDLVITGKPEIPDELDLLAPTGLKGWMTDYYGIGLGQSPFAWELDEVVLTSPQTLDANPSRDRRKVENIIRYHRPMLEDGEVSYEFYYDPEVKLAAPASDRLSYLGANAPKRTMKGKTLVHPALDRMVCLLEPDGVKIHWLTDGRWDRTGLTADNVDPPTLTRRASEGERSTKPANGSPADPVPEEGSRSERSPSLARRVSEVKPLPLKPRDWNSIKFRTKGDTLTIELNGDIVFTRDIEPTNLRHFGLFHYANESNVRVRNVRYRGDWPKTLPSIEQQDLAVGPQKFAAIPDAELPDSMSWDFTKSRFDPKEFNFFWDANVAAKHLLPTDAGLQFQLRTGETKPQVAGIHPQLRISGDFIATVEYSGLKTILAKEFWGSGLSFKVQLDGSYETGFENRRWGGSGAKVTAAMWMMISPHKQYLYSAEQLTDFPESARLRLQRRGPVLYYFIADAGSDDFRLVTHRPVGTSDLLKLNIQADASDAAAGAEFVIKNLSIRAAKITKVK